MQRILLAAFMRGIGGGLALAATPYVLAGGVGVLRGVAGIGKRLGRWAEDAGDGLRYYGELRGHRKATGRAAGWQPEQDGFEVE